MPRGSSPKREKEYDDLVKSFKDEGRYKGREEEVAARIVNKQRAEFSETKDAKAADRAGESPDRDLPIKNYDHLTADQVASRAEKLSDDEIEEIEEYEKEHRDRKTVVEALEKATS